jgi:hypothetical protein
MTHEREFECIDCGVTVVAFGPPTANDDSVCATCAWLRGIDDPVEREKLREFLERR